MKRLLFVGVLAAFCGAPAVAKQLVTVPANTVVPLVSDSVIVGTVAMNSGDELDFHVASPVIVDGYIVIPSDAKAFGHFVSGGGMKISVFGATKFKPVVYALDYVVSADGKKIQLNGSDQSPPAPNGIETPHLPFSPKQQSIQILNKGTKVQGAVDHTVHVEATQKSDAANGYDH